MHNDDCRMFPNLRMAHAFHPAHSGATHGNTNAVQCGAPRPILGFLTGIFNRVLVTETGHFQTGYSVIQDIPTGHNRLGTSGRLLRTLFLTPYNAFVCVCRDLSVSTVSSGTEHNRVAIAVSQTTIAQQTTTVYLAQGQWAARHRTR